MGREVEELWGSQTKTGINFSKYDSIPVKVLGENKPAPLVNFQSSGLATVVLENVKRAEYTIPTPVQKHGMHIIMAGRDLMASAQTGSGKTAAFLLPIIDRIISTAVAARGLDIPNVMHVVNYDMPKEVDEYIHRIGRTGRVGNTGRATSFFDERENAALARPLVKVLTDVKQPVPEWLAGQSRGGYY